MKYKVVSTDFICKIRGQNYLFLEVFKIYNKKIQFKKDERCQNKKCANYSLKKAGSHPLALLKSLKSKETYKKYTKKVFLKSRAVHPRQKKNVQIFI